MDGIKHKLTLIDRELRGARLSHRRMISTAPLFFAATGLIAGILIQDTARCSIKLWLILLASGAISAFVLLAVRKEAGSEAVTAYTAFLCFACLGAIRLTSFSQARPDDIRNLIKDEPRLATIRGLIITQPYINRNKHWAFGKSKPTDPTSSFYLRVREVRGRADWAKVTGTARVQVDEPVINLKAGDYIQAYCWLDRFKEPTNPGQFNTAKYLARRNVFIAVSIKSRDAIRLFESHNVAVLTKVRQKLRQTATQALLGGLEPDSPSEGLLQALLLGYRRDIDRRTYEAFRNTGLLHFISLSGMHLGILIGTIWWLCKTAGLMKPARAVICIIAIAVFMLIVPPRAPTLRAAIIGWVFCISFLFRRRPNSLNTLSLAAIILLLIGPTQLFEAGWQLSFASVLGLVLFCHRIHFFLYEKIAGLPWAEKAPKTKPFFRIVSRPGPYLLRLFSTGLTAWLSGAGILLYHFYTINPITSIWTVAVFPLVALILTFGYLKMALSLLLPTAAAMLGIFVTAMAYILIWIVQRIAQLDISQILIGHVPIAVIILYYCLVLFTGFVYLRRAALKKAICTAMALTLVLFLGITKWQRINRDNLVVTCLDVGHGQAILTQLPGRANLLFDAGSLHKSDIGGRTVTPFLDYIGINKIEAIIISHNDVDHINGIPEIVGHCRVGGVYANDAFFAQADQWGTAKFLTEDLKKRDLQVDTLDEKPKFSKKADIRILWPSEHTSQYDKLSDNDKSAVILIEFADTKILLCSDIERFAQQELFRLYPALKADVVVVPHHGSVRTAETGFLERLGADILICSCSTTELEKRQANTQKSKPKWLCTASHGAVTVCIERDQTVQTTTFTRAP